MRDADRSSQSPEFFFFSDLTRTLSDSHAVLWGIILVASVLDILTTIIGLSYGLREGNLVARAFVEAYGTPGIGLLKFSALVLVVILWGVLRDRLATIVLFVFATVSLLVVANNTLVLAGI